MSAMHTLRKKLKWYIFHQENKKKGYYTLLVNVIKILNDLLEATYTPITNLIFLLNILVTCEIIGK